MADCKKRRCTQYLINLDALITTTDGYNNTEFILLFSIDSIPSVHSFEFIFTTMGKKSKRKNQSQPSSSSTPSLEDEQQSNPHPSLRLPVQPSELQCEDPYEDLYEDEDDVSYEDVYESSGDEEDMVQDDPVDTQPSTNNNNNQQQEITSWNPFTAPPPTTELQINESAYKMHHALTPEWPSLSLDILSDRTLGENRTRFPHVITMAVGSQAERNNKLTILRMSDLGRMPREKTEKEMDDEMLGEEWNNEDDESSSSEEEEEEEYEPLLEHYTFPHEGGINRIRACPQNNDVIAVWGERATVSLYDVGGALDTLDRSTRNSSSGTTQESSSMTTVRKMRKDPFFVYQGHSTEGYAVDWSRVVPGRMATADCHGHIHIWNALHAVSSKETTSKSSSLWGNSSFEVKPTYSPHGENIDTPSVEDLQWSPNEATVLASAECGGIVRIYDVRCPNRAMISNKIHGSGADVNVISWNRLVSNLLASGGDDGELFVLF